MSRKPAAVKKIKVDKDDSHLGKQVEIKCKGAGVIELDNLTEFQGALKEFPEGAYEKLKASIIELGFSFPVFAWKYKNKNYILDATHRVITLKRMRDEGFVIPKLPVVWIEAVDKVEAAKKLLAASSQYATVTKDGLTRFLEEFKIEPLDLNNLFVLPEINLESPKFEFELGDSGVIVLDSIAVEQREVEKKKEIKEERKAATQIFKIEDITEEAFKYFRSNGFPYPKMSKHEIMQELNKLSSLDNDSLVNSTVAYKIADSFHSHRFDAAAINMSSPVESFNDDKKLKKSIRWALEGGANVSTELLGTMNIVNGTQACSNFRPAFAKFIYDNYSKKDAVIFDSSTGYGGRLVGFLASEASKYIGTDPNKPTYLANSKIRNELGKHKTIDLHNSPIEDLDVSEYLNKCDLAFTSPPYFIKETYSKDSTQSCSRYPEYESWIDGFLKPMLQKQFDVLKPGSFNIVNIEDVNVSGKNYKLVEPTIEIAQDIGFDFISIEKFNLPNRTVLKDGQKVSEESYESVIVLKKN